MATFVSLMSMIVSFSFSGLPVGLASFAAGLASLTGAFLAGASSFFSSLSFGAFFSFGSFFSLGSFFSFASFFGFPSLSRFLEPPAVFCVALTLLGLGASYTSFPSDF
jgi:hypothetical protein